MSLIFYPEIKEDIKSSYQWYQQQAEGLGDDFILELEASYQVISEFPDAWSSLHKDFKRYLLPKFPFSVIYRKSGSNIFVVAIMHNRRKPNYWHERT